jgi:riboflavin kinase/FMN adenylyltransferase
LRIVDGSIGTKDGVVAALGVFDGVHIGHQALFRKTRAESERLGIPAVAVTFHPHPRTLLGGHQCSITLLTPPPEKMALIEDLGLDYFWQISFTNELANTSPEEFVGRYLVDILQVRHVVCGFNFSFGKGGKGSPALLERLGQEYGFSVSVVPPIRVRGEVVSSTKIRRDLEAGKVDEARECLGRPYCLWGIVERGDGRGKTIGIPTSNVDLGPEKALPANGVYSALVRASFVGETGERRLVERSAVVNVGTRPTFRGKDTRVEVHIPGFSGNLYGERIQVFLVRRIRDERAFSGADELRSQVAKDILAVSEMPLLGSGSGQEASFTVPRAYDRMLSPDVP